MSERNHLIEVQCRLCGEVHELVVNYEDYKTYRLPNRPHIQDCFPYLSPEEHELLISGTCDKCWDKMFGGEDDE